MVRDNNVMSAIRKRGWLTRAASCRRILPIAAWPDTVRELQRKHFTGLVEVIGSKGQSVILLFAHGAIMEAYHQQGESLFTRTTASLPPPHGEDIAVEMFILPLDGVQAMKTLIEQGVPLQTKWMTTTGLEPFCRALSRQMRGVVHVVWQKTEGFVILTGPSAMSGVFVSDCEIINASKGLAALFTYTEASCYVHLYPGEGQLVNSIESEKRLLLRRAFTTFADDVLSEYTRLVGRRLGNLVTLELNRIAREHGWHIQFSLNGTTETHQFASLEEMRNVYRTLFHLLMGYISIVVGDQLTVALVKRVLDRIDKTLRPLISDIAALPIAI